jgi:transposase-like protein
MERRKWDSKTKLTIVLLGLKGRSVGEICNEYQVSQTQYYKWRDQFLEQGHKAFETIKISQKEERLQRENQRLKNLVGELTLELKKSDDHLD